MKKLIAVFIALSVFTLPAIADNPQPRKIYSGWIPYYGMKNSLPTALNNADLIKEVMPFWYMLKASNGVPNIVDLYSQNNTGVEMSYPLKALQQAGFKIIPTITDGTDKGVLAGLISTEPGRTQLVQSIVNLVNKTAFDGIDLDWEGFAFVDGSASWDTTKPNWIAFIKALGDALHANNKLLSVTTPYLLDPASGKKGYYVYAWAEIAQSIDRLHIMTYDYSVASPGPIGPIGWTENTLKYAIAVMPASKVYIGLAGYGRDWVTKVDGICPADVIKTITPTAKAATFLMSNAQNLAAGYGATINYDNTFQEATFTYQKTYNGNTSTGLSTSCTATRTAWYQDARAYQARAQLVSKYHIGGVAAWTIGLEDPSALQSIRDVALSIAPDQVVAKTNLNSGISYVYGQLISLSGLVTLADKSPISNLSIALERGTDNNWNRLDTLLTNNQGNLTSNFVLGKSSDVRIHSDGTWERTEGISNVQSIKILPLININGPIRVRNKTTLIISGQIQPTGNQTLNLQMADGGSWRSVGTLSADGEFTFSYPVNNVGFLNFRVTSEDGGISNSLAIVSTP